MGRFRKRQTQKLGRNESQVQSFSQGLLDNLGLAGGISSLSFQPSIPSIYSVFPSFSPQSCVAHSGLGFAITKDDLEFLLFQLPQVLRITDVCHHSQL